MESHVRRLVDHCAIYGTTLQMKNPPGRMQKPMQHVSNLQLPPGEEVFHYQMVKPANFLENGKAFFLYFISTYY